MSTLPSLNREDSMEDVDDKHDTHHPVRKFFKQTFGVLTMMFASSQILYSYVCEPDTLPKSYLSFLITHGGIRAMQPTRAREYLNAFGATINGSIVTGSAKFVTGKQNFADSIPKGLPADKLVAFEKYLTQAPHDFLMCALQHPNSPLCSRGFIDSFLGEWKRAFMLYAPLNIVSLT